MTEVTEVGEPSHKGLLLGRVLFCHTRKKIIKDHLLYDQPAHSFYLFSFFVLKCQYFGAPF